MTRKKKLESALTTAEHYRNYSQRLKGFLKESEEKIEMLENENEYLKTRCAFFTWDKQEYSRLKKENKELKKRIEGLEVIVDVVLAIPKIGGAIK